MSTDEAPQLVASARRSTVRLWSFQITLVLFIASLTQDGFFIDGGNPRAWAPCIANLLLGWIPVFEGVLAWLANPMLALTWLFMWRGSSRRDAFATVWFAAMALCLSLSFLFCREIVTSEAGHYSKISGYGLGYWLWNASIATTLIGSLVALRYTPNAQKKVESRE